MDNIIFSQSISRIRFLETKMLERGKLDALSEAKDFEDALRMLQDTRYGEYVSMPSYEEGLKLAVEDLYRDMYKISPVKEVVDILAIRYDAHNIKSLIKGKLTGINTENLLINAGTISVQSLKTMIKEENFRYMPKTLRASTERALENFKNNKNPQDIDVMMDKGIYEYMLEIGGESKLEYLIEVTRFLIDIINIKSFIRAKLQEKDREFLRRIFLTNGSLDTDIFINNVNDSLENFVSKIMHTNHYKWVKEGISEYLKTFDPGSIEKYGDNYIMEHVKKSKLISFGPEPIIAYIISTENEIKALRIILTGKNNEVNPDTIRERLRDVYV